MAANGRRWGAGTAAVARALFDADYPITQTWLAEQAHITQAAVSQVISRFVRDGVAYRVDNGWLPERWTLIIAYHSNYSSRLQDVGYWYRVDSIQKQARALGDLAARVAVSGDAAADVINPWRNPTKFIAYTDATQRNLLAARFVRADDRNSATLITRDIPDDQFYGEITFPDNIPIAHPLHVAADLLDLGGSDRRDAAERFTNRSGRVSGPVRPSKR